MHFTTKLYGKVPYEDFFEIRLLCHSRLRIPEEKREECERKRRVREGEIENLKIIRGEKKKRDRKSK